MIVAGATLGRLADAVREIRAILARRERAPPPPARAIIDALWDESALDKPWLYQAFNLPNDCLQILSLIKGPETDRAG